MGVKILGPIKLKYLFIFTMKICKENILLIIKHICYLKYDFALFLFRFLHFIVSIFQSNLKRIPFGSHHVTFFRVVLMSNDLNALSQKIKKKYQCCKYWENI